jgi:hypothetical protein
MGSSRVSRAVSKVAVAVRVGIGSFVRHSEEPAELVRKGIELIRVQLRQYTIQYSKFEGTVGWKSVVNRS